MLNYPEKISKLIDSFLVLPGVGRKTAERFVFHLLKRPKALIEKFSIDLKDLLETNFTCPECYNFSEQNGLCPICSNINREQSTICIVEEIQDLIAIENTNQYKGLYHVLGGKIDLVEGISPEKLTIEKLINRIKQKQIKEAIFALNPDLQGEGTILYLKSQLAPLNVKITLLARGLPMGGDIEYADEITLTNALKGRLELK